MNCKGCKYAAWEYTESGRLSPSGYGTCTAPIKLPELPKAYYWLGTPRTGGGPISRKPLSLKATEGCQRWQPLDDKP
jgi:hypothetical protein